MTRSTSSSEPGISSYLSCLIVVIVLLVLIIISLVSFFGSLSTFTSWKEGRCTITSKTLYYRFGTSGTSKRRTLYAPGFTFTLQTADGSRYDTSWQRKFIVDRGEQERILDQYSVGEVYSCWYNPAHPTSAVLIREVEPVDAFISVGVMLAVLLGVGFIARRHFKRLIKQREKQRETKRELETAEKSVQLHPNDPAAYYQEGNALYNQKRYQEALVAYEHVIQLAPDDTRAYKRKGDILRKLNRYEVALDAYERAIPLAPADAEIYSGQGDAFAKLDHNEEALAAYERVLELAPDNASAWIGNVEVLSKLNRNQEA